jgi:hypothetical protein
LSLESIISGIDKEIATLQKAKDVLSGLDVKRGPGRPRIATLKKQRRQLSPEARESIAAAQRARWAATKKSVSKPTKAKA